MTPIVDSMIYEVRWHGRGGQGAVTSAQILAEAAFYDGYQGVAAAPYFGAERRGAPVTATTRFSVEPIRIYSLVENPDVVMVLDDTLLKSTPVARGLREGGWLLINSQRKPQEISITGNFGIATVDASGIAREQGLVVAGVVVANIPILGAFARVIGLISLKSLYKAIQSRFSPSAAENNLRAAQLTFERTVLRQPAASGVSRGN